MPVHQAPDHWSRSLTVEVSRVAVARTRVANFCEVLHHVLRGPQVDRGAGRHQKDQVKQPEDVRARLVEGDEHQPVAFGQAGQGSHQVVGGEAVEAGSGFIQNEDSWGHCSVSPDDRQDAVSGTLPSGFQPHLGSTEAAPRCSLSGARPQTPHAHMCYPRGCWRTASASAPQSRPPPEGDRLSIQASRATLYFPSSMFAPIVMSLGSEQIQPGEHRLWIGNQTGLQSPHN